MANYTEIYNLHNDTNLMNRVETAIARAATDVFNEPPTAPNNVARTAWATTALTDTHAMAVKMMWGIVGNATIQAGGSSANISDADIQLVVNNLVNTYAN